MIYSLRDTCGVFNQLEVRRDSDVTEEFYSSDSQLAHYGRTVGARCRKRFAMRTFTRRFTPARVTGYRWFVIIGDDCERTEEVWALVPDETYIRKLLSIPAETSVLIGRP